MSVLNHKQFNTLFPYHMIIGKDMVIKEIGKSLLKIDSKLIHKDLNDVFEIFRPKFLELNYDNLIESSNELILLKLKSNKDFLFRYQLIHLDNSDLLLIGSLWLTDIDLLVKNNLQLSDFAMHDAMTDMLQVLRSKEIVMNEIRFVLEEKDIQKKQLLELKNQLGVVLENMPSALLLEDNDRKMLFTNKNFCKLFEIPAEPEQIIGINCAEAGESSKKLFQNEDSFIPRINELLSAGIKNQGELLEMKNGKILERDFIPVYSNNIQIGILWQYKDVTQEKKSAYLLQQSEIKYRSLIENLSLGLMEVDLDGVIRKVYPSFCELTGYTETELLGQKSVDFLLDPDDVLKMQQETSRRLNGVTSIYEVRLRKKDKSIIWVIISGAPILDINNNVVGSIGLHWDITNRIQKEEELLKAKEQAEKSSQVKKEFMAKMSHELRTPLNVIKGMTHLLSNSDLTNDQKEDLDSIIKSNETLTNLVSDLLDISIIESGKLVVNNKSFMLHELILDLSNHFYFIAKEKGLQFNLKLFPEVPLNITNDEVKIKQILTNLLSNAIKFTHTGYINFEINFSGENLLIKVEDSGIGIPKEKQKEVFELFAQADTDINKNYGGTGLGLTITKELVQLLNGSIELNSTELEGTLFQLIIPVNRIEKIQANNQLKEPNFIESDSLDDITVLVVEDNPLNQQLLQKILTNWKVKFDICENGLFALKKLEQKNYDLVLMDILMPVMNGIETTKKIRTHRLKSIQTIPIIGVSASGSNEEIELGLHAGMNDFITKPIEIELLKNTISKWCVEKKRNFKYVNLNYFKQNHLNDDASISNIAKIYSYNTPGLLNKINDAIDLKSLSTVKLEIHSLKSNAKLFGISQLENYLDSLEKNSWFQDDTIKEIKTTINILYHESLQEILTLINKE